jgi:glyoxylase-like metal-dependent hydrolase (beta-lactamase superfamily II)
VSTAIALPVGVQVFERGWLSANNILLTGDGPTALIDSGYYTHAPQTLALVAQALNGRSLDLLLNTHLHSDHCGGNAALQSAHPGVRTWIPPGHLQQVRDWDAVALTYVPTGQTCPRFEVDEALRPDSVVHLGGQAWQVHAAAGHDPHSIVLFEPRSRILISADALWENGFGVVFPELEGEQAFDEVGRTLDLIEALEPACVIPGHGAVFVQVDHALAAARKRLEGFIAAPAKHARHAAKVLLKFKLLEVQAFTPQALHQWAMHTAYLDIIRRRWEPDTDPAAWVEALADDLVGSGAASRAEGRLLNA